MKLISAMNTSNANPSMCMCLFVYVGTVSLTVQFWDRTVLLTVILLLYYCLWEWRLSGTLASHLQGWEFKSSLNPACAEFACSQVLQEFPLGTLVFSPVQRHVL